MPRGRLEAFSDAIIAIAITIMVLELPKPESATFAALGADLPVLLAYLLSFVYLGIYWNNHHHLLALVTRVDGRVLWANLHLLFWLSLVPFVTEWMSETGFAVAPTISYGVLLLAAALAFTLLQRSLVRAQPTGSRLADTFGRDLKGKLSPVLYAFGVAGTLLHPLVGIAFYTVVALIWLIPDSRVERMFPRDGLEPVARDDA